MKIIISAFLCLILGLVPFIPASVFSLPQDALYWKDLAIPVLALFIFLSALISRRNRPQDFFAEFRKYPEEPDEDMATRLAAEFESLRGDNQVLIEGKETLQATLQEVLGKLKEAKSAAASSMERDAQIDAELVNLLSLLQGKGRLIDFLKDDITTYPDAQVGAAARVVHNGCADVLKEYFKIAAIHDAAEGSTVSLEAGYDTDKFRLVGKVGGEPPFKGNLLHHGWIVEEITLPRLVKTGEELKKHRVITPAEVELA